MPIYIFIHFILLTGMRERAVVIKRRSALVIGNMCKLVNDPRTAAQFYPILKPVLERGRYLSIYCIYDDVICYDLIKVTSWLYVM